MLSTIFYKINTAAANLRKNVEEAFTPKTPVITSTEPVFFTNTSTATPTLEHTTVLCETVLPTESTDCVNGICSIASKLMRQRSIINIEERITDCSGICVNCECKVVPDVEDCGLTATTEPISEIKSTLHRVCSKSACGCITNFDINCDKTEKCIDDMGCYDGNNECCQDE